MLRVLYPNVSDAPWLCTRPSMGGRKVCVYFVLGIERVEQANSNYTVWRQMEFITICDFYNLILKIFRTHTVWVFIKSKLSELLIMICKLIFNYKSIRKNSKLYFNHQVRSHVNKESLRMLSTIYVSRVKSILKDNSLELLVFWYDILKLNGHFPGSSEMGWVN